MKIVMGHVFDLQLNSTQQSITRHMHWWKSLLTKRIDIEAGLIESISWQFDYYNNVRRLLLRLLYLGWIGYTRHNPPIHLLAKQLFGLNGWQPPLYMLC